MKKIMINWRAVALNEELKERFSRATYTAQNFTKAMIAIEEITGDLDGADDRVLELAVDLFNPTWPTDEEIAYMLTGTDTGLE